MLLCIVPTKPSAAALAFLCFADSQRSRVRPMPVLERGGVGHTEERVY